ncbi:MAG: hypothetical protein KDJ19_12490 [Hyphomicrobiaceae bacterium]|nr:hypothetical protein [Hyphomicrobiaceae bacterium]MCC0022732.1 hypothetical protein [Hyphomicrobiaceae bacterium]
MRTQLAAATLAAALILPISAQGAETYTNARFGFQFDVPDGFTAVQASSENGDGQVFVTADQRATLTLFGGNVTEPSFAAEVGQATQYARNTGWNITYEAGQNGWGVYSGLFTDQILYARMEAQCNDTQFAAVWLLFQVQDRPVFEPLTNELAQRLKTNSDCK